MEDSTLSTPPADPGIKFVPPSSDKTSRKIKWSTLLPILVMVMALPILVKSIRTRLLTGSRAANPTSYCNASYGCPTPPPCQSTYGCPTTINPTIIPTPTSTPAPISHAGSGELTDVLITSSLGSASVTSTQFTVSGARVQNYTSIVGYYPSGTTTNSITFQKLGNTFASSYANIPSTCVDIKSSTGTYLFTFCLRNNTVGYNEREYAYAPYQGTDPTQARMRIFYRYNQFQSGVKTSLQSLTAAYDRNLTPNFQPTNIYWVFQSNMSPAYLDSLEFWFASNQFVSCSPFTGAAMNTFTGLLPGIPQKYSSGVVPGNPCMFRVIDSVRGETFANFNRKFMMINASPLAPTPSTTPVLAPTPTPSFIPTPTPTTPSTVPVNTPVPTTVPSIPTPTPTIAVIPTPVSTSLVINTSFLWPPFGLINRTYTASITATSSAPNDILSMTTNNTAGLRISSCVQSNPSRTTSTRITCKLTGTIRRTGNYPIGVTVTNLRGGRVTKTFYLRIFNISLIPEPSPRLPINNDAL